ncbi:MAG: hypothetical protein AAGM84_03580 [Pseudomonadota bacterium]
MTVLTYIGGFDPLETSSFAWNDPSNNIVNLSAFFGLSVDIDLGAETTLTSQDAFVGVILLGMTADSAFTWDTNTDTNQPFFADGATIKARDLSTVTISIEVGSLGTLNFDGAVTLDRASLSDAPDGLKSGYAIDVNFSQSDSMARDILIDGSGIYGNVVTDSYSKLILNFSNVFGHLEVNNDIDVFFGTVSGTFSMFGATTLNLTGFRFNIGGDNTATSMGIIGDDAAQIINGLGGSINVTGRMDFKGGDDQVTLSGNMTGDIQMGRGADMLTLGGSTDYAINAGPDGDTITITGTIDSIIRLGSGADTLDLSAATVNGGLARGGADNDTMIGSAGADRLFGDAGDDTITGGSGRDFLVGRAGADVFVFDSGDSIQSARDYIRDFRKTDGDKIDVSAIATVFNGSGSFSGTAGEVIVIGRSVRVDEDGDGVGDTFISLQGSIALTASDFILG